MTNKIIFINYRLIWKGMLSSDGTQRDFIILCTYLSKSTPLAF